MGAHLLSDNDVAVLKRIARIVLGTTYGGGLGQDQDTGQASDIYVARVPDEGIPELTIGSPDVPGEAECQIYRIAVNGTGTGNTEMEEIEGLVKTVYNIHTTRISSRYATVEKTKSGRWVAQNSGITDTDTGTGTGSLSCITSLDGVVLGDLEIGNVDTGTGPQIQYALGLDDSGCLILIPIGTC